MGYMGFGTRKEAYTRKPKIPFRKIKLLYQQELKKQKDNPTYKEADPAVLSEIRAHLIKRQKRSYAKQISALVLLTIVIGSGTYFLFNYMSTPLSGNPISIQEKYFHTVIHKVNDNQETRVEYFRKGPKSRETRYKNGMRHQNSESYYETGEQFRSATYLRDTLINEVYFYKNGDTIIHFPGIEDYRIHHLRIIGPQKKDSIEFDFYDGKILTGTYREF
ncbi:hypothetical protein FNH22_30485 [Fulvivirga sp. M361]|uniref:hypothetical protein n=1 Tax=Fulvivirga sp. M361 TaxID=2594266 RepID=UPI00117994E8|nr:hypothetical protein [Fulvivirga sp. M361]TRX47149.1 hypothetical protein FNH22_30485 [Fulvivirga sp. M361]